MSDSAKHYEQGKVCYQNKKFPEAIHEFTEAIRLKPADNNAAARCYNARGVVYFYLGEFKKVGLRGVACARVPPRPPRRRGRAVVAAR
jgi:Flp pilus assembly protein TadD